MTRLFLVLVALSVPATAYAQFPSQNITVPAFVLPASAVTGSGVVTSATLCFDVTSPDACLSRGAADVLMLASGDKLAFGGVTSSQPLLKANSAQIESRLADDSNYASFKGNNLKALSGVQLGASDVMAISATAPTITSAGTSPSVTSANGTVAGRINVGTGGTATTIVMALPTATTGWNCTAQNITGNAANRANLHMVQQSSTTTAATLQWQTVSTGVATAFTASDSVAYICFAY